MALDLYDRIALARIFSCPLCSAWLKHCRTTRLKRLHSESVPDGVRQDFSGVFVYEDKLAPKSAVSPNGRELLKDSRFKLV